MKKFFSSLLILLLVGVPITALLTGAFLLIRGITDYVTQEKQQREEIAKMGPVQKLEAQTAGKNLLEARKNFTSQYRPSTPQTGRVPLTPPPGLQLVTYPTNKLGRMSAYADLDLNLKENGVVVWVHDGQQGIGRREWQIHTMAKQAGLQFFAPSFRGEHRNQGKPEFLFGEVRDLLDCLEWLRKENEVNPDRIFLCGENQGATLIMLAMGTGSAQVQAAFAWGGELEMVNLPFARERAEQDLDFNDRPTGRNQNLEQQRQMEGWLRSPKGFLSAVRKPLYFFSSTNPAQVTETPPTNMVHWQEVDSESRKRHATHALQLLFQTMRNTKTFDSVSHIPLDLPKPEVEEVLD